MATAAVSKTVEAKALGGSTPPLSANCIDMSQSTLYSLKGVEKRLHKLVELMPYGIIVWLTKNDNPKDIKIVFTNERSSIEFRSVTGKSVKDSLAEWKDNPCPDTIIRVAHTERGETIQNVLYTTDESESEGYFKITFVSLGNGYVATIYENVSVQRRLQARLKQMALEDTLTGLVNLRGFKKALRESLGRAERAGKMIALLFCDLDGFKAVNDMFGHETGDLCLKTIAEKLRKSVRQIDKVGRLGGDEFGIILEGIMQETDVKTISQKIIDSISEAPLYLGGRRKAQLGISIGIALAVSADEDLDLILQHADAAMYKAKESGGNMYLFHNGHSQVG